ncbi:PREDICTED: 17 [Prunus dulcis]|uniref:PREDICTED: 17 n=1 Tax=Prunus dulcis TaxID=3755 RepID=A0A5E4G158_PRUDU|nr:PREDICTED: 17 [Prunus dulcis]
MEPAVDYIDGLIDRLPYLHAKSGKILSWASAKQLPLAPNRVATAGDSLAKVAGVDKLDNRSVSKFGEGRVKNVVVLKHICWGRGGISDWEQQGGGDETSAVANAHVDWRETDNAHIFVADLPGVKKEDVKVHVEDGNMLQISGQRVQEQEKTED